jgi:inosine/xanthosine triphosphatase
MMTRVGVGGTFNSLHKGHRALLDKAFEVGDEVLIGVTSEVYVVGRKPFLRPTKERLAELDEYLVGKGKPYHLLVIEDAWSNAAQMPELDAMVVSPESAENAEHINKLRSMKGLVPLQIVMIPYVLAQDYCPISSTRILKGDIDPEGRLLRPLRVAVGTLNPIKVEAVRSVLSKMFVQVEVMAVEVDSGVGKEPFEGDVLKGAMNRARRCLGRNDIGIGIEAGVYLEDDGLYDIQQCAVLDKMGWITHGHGLGFHYPPSIERMIRQGKSVGEACDQLFHLEKNGHKGGAIGLLTDGMLKRKELTEQSVLAAMVPRIRADLYL